MSPLQITEASNRAMRDFMARRTPSTELVAPLQSILDAGFVEKDGCLFLAAEAGDLPHPELLDRTGREALHNHLHIEDGLLSTDDELGQGLLYARELAARLAAAPGARPFHVVLALGDSVTVRFYRVRDDEPAWIAADLEGYGEAVLALVGR